MVLVQMWSACEVVRCPPTSCGSTRLLLTLEFELDAWTRGGVAPGLALLTFGIVGAGRRHL